MYNKENIVEKRRTCYFGAISAIFHNIVLSVVRFSCFNGTRFSLRIKRLFEINEVEILRVDCNYMEYKPIILLVKPLTVEKISEYFSVISEKYM